MDSFLDSDSFELYAKLFQEIKKEYKDLIDSTSNGSISDYYESNINSRYNISVQMQPVLDNISVNFISIASDVELIFNNIDELNNIMDMFIEYYGKIKIISEKSNLTREDKTWIVAIDLILLYNNDKLKYKTYNILKSMCKFPQLGTLVQLTERVL